MNPGYRYSLMPPRIRALVLVPNTKRAISTDVCLSCPAMSYETISSPRLRCADANDRSRSFTRWERIPRMAITRCSLLMNAAKGGDRKYSVCRRRQNESGPVPRFLKSSSKHSIASGGPALGESTSPSEFCRILQKDATRDPAVFERFYKKARQLPRNSRAITMR